MSGAYAERVPSLGKQRTFGINFPVCKKAFEVTTALLEHHIRNNHPLRSRLQIVYATP